MEPPTIDFIPRVFYKNKNEELKLNKNIIQNSKIWEGYKEISYKNIKIKFQKFRKIFKKIIWKKMVYRRKFLVC